MTKTTAPVFAKGLMTVLGSILALLSFVAVLAGNWNSLQYASGSQLILYVLLPSLAALGMCCMLSLRLSPLFTVIPVAMGCLVYAMMEGYLFLLFTNPADFGMVFQYLDTVTCILIVGVVVCVLAGCVLYVLSAMGRCRREELAMIFVGLAILFLLAEYLKSVLTSLNASPWYMLESGLMLGSMLCALLAFEYPRRAKTAYAPTPKPETAAEADETSAAEE